MGWLSISLCRFRTRIYSAFPQIIVLFSGNKGCGDLSEKTLAWLAFREWWLILANRQRCCAAASRRNKHTYMASRAANVGRLAGFGWHLRRDTLRPSCGVEGGFEAFSEVDIRLFSWQGDSRELISKVA